MRMPPLPADSIHARACKLKCEKILTRPNHSRRQNGAGTGSGSRCYTGADLSGMSRSMGKAVTLGSVAAGISVTILFFSEF